MGGDQPGALSSCGGKQKLDPFFRPRPNYPFHHPLAGGLWRDALGGGIRGLVQINTTNDSTEGWRIAAGEADLDVYALGVDRKYVWAALRSGVYQFDPVNGEWEFLSELDGLASNEIYQIRVDGDHVWFATALGVSRFFWNAPHLRK